MTKLDFQEPANVPPADHPPAPRIAYIVSGFPNIYETFILYDLLAMQELGVAVELYPLRRQYPKIVHQDAQAWVERAHYRPFLSLRVLRAQWHFLHSNPLGYLKLWAEVCRETWGSANFFLGAMAIFPKAVLFAQEMRQQRITHVHAHFANHPAVAAFVIHRLTGIPFSFTARGGDVQVDRHMLKAKVEASEFVIAVSSDNKRIMAKETSPKLAEKIQIIYGGVDVDRLLPNHARSSAGPLKLLCIARMEEVKGHKYLIEACQVLRQRGIPFECRLIGEGPLYRTIQAQIKQAGLDQLIQFGGPRAYQEVIQELAQADVVVLPTAPTAQGDREGIPNVLKEAMACGLPVVASRSGGIPELVDHERTGILVPPRDPTALADALQRLYDDPGLRNRFGQAGRDKIVREFNLKSSVMKRAWLFLGASEAVASRAARSPLNDHSLEPIPNSLPTRGQEPSPCAE